MVGAPEEMHPSTLMALSKLAEARRQGIVADGGIVDAITELVRSDADAVLVAAGLLIDVDHIPRLRPRALQLFDALNRGDAPAIIEASMDLASLTVPPAPHEVTTKVRLAVEVLCGWVDGRYVP